MQNHQKQLLKALLKANAKGELSDILNSISTNIKGSL
jgi:hypothetical protein